MYEKRCGNCQTLYRIIEQKVSFRDSDFLQCKICGSELHRWSGAVVCRGELVETAKPSSNKVYQEAEAEERLELLEDTAIAREAEEEYERQGLEGTTPYSGYRSKRLGSESSV